MTAENPPTQLTVRRRSLVRGVLALGAAAFGALVTGCSDSSPSGSAFRSAESTSPSAEPTAGAVGNSVLLAYFSRPGENYYYGDRIDLEVGNTEVLAGIIADRIDCDVHRIEPVELYPHD
jgi:flavodoxin